MLLNILVIAFVAGFTGIAVLGHVLLLTAIWPDLFGKPARKDTTGHAPPLPQVNR
jgi:hypothetical protein